MYYPYLRGKQFDLLALMELAKRHRLSKRIAPIIEPVRDSATLKNTIQLLTKAQQPFYIIENPMVGSYKLLDRPKHSWEKSTATARLATLDSPEASTADMLMFSESTAPKRRQQLLDVHHTKGLVVIPDESRFRLWLPKRQILLTDNFPAHKNTAHYIEKTDDFFSNQHLYYKEDGYLGFSDYGIDGRVYYDKGYPSRTLVIHITYFDAYSNLRVKHFVSDSNEHAGEQQTKFLEAAEKLDCWCSKYRDQLLMTIGMNELLSCYRQGKFPGLGVIKKWSLAHHLELVSAFLEKAEHWQFY